MSSSGEKGDALEGAVRAIETAILRNAPGYAEGTFTIEGKKILRIADVRHEIDVYVIATLAPKYEAVFIFECKNWKDKVGKNEIIVFSEKIRVSRAQRGFFVAAEFTADAEAQTAQDPRMELLKAIELNPDTLVVPAGFHSIHVGQTTAEVWFRAEATSEKPGVTLDIPNAHLVLDGIEVDAHAHLQALISASRDKRMNSLPSGAMEEGIHKVAFTGAEEYEAGRATLNGRTVIAIEVDGSTDVVINRAVVVSAYEVEARSSGRSQRTSASPPSTSSRCARNELTGVGADGHVIEAAAAPPHFMDWPQHNLTLGRAIIAQEHAE
jgi:hypothetical protein